MFNFFAPKAVNSILDQFVKIKKDLEVVMVYHTNKAIAKKVEIEAHDAEYNAAMKAYKAVEKFI